MVLTCNTCINAQEKELVFENDTYIYNQDKNTICNKKNQIPIEKKTCLNYSVNGKISFDFIPEVFTQKELAQLDKDKKFIVVTCMCDSKGVILEVLFSFKEKDTFIKDIKLSQINAIEKYIIGQNVDITNTCPDTKYYYMFQIIKYKDYLR